MKDLDPWNQYGYEKGFAQGLAEARAEARAERFAEGFAEGSSNIILRVLNRRFGDIDESVVQQIKCLSMPVLDRLIDEILDFQSSSDIEEWLANAE